MITKLEGVIPALPTPFDASGNLDEGGLSKLVQHVLKGGVNGLWVLGSTSEFPALNSRERQTIIDICVHEAGKKVPVLVGVGNQDQRELIKNADQACRNGASACFATLPYYFTLDTAESVNYLREVAQAVSLPFIFYDNPFSTNVKLDTKTMVEIAAIPNLIAIKDSAGDYRRFLEVSNLLADTAPYALLQGLDQLVGPSFLIGASRGAVLALAAVMPALFSQLYRAASAGEVETFRTLQKKVLHLCTLYEVMGAPTDGAFFAGVKAALEVQGICTREVAAPFSAMPAEKMADVEAILATCM